MLKLKLMAALTALTTMECVSPVMSSAQEEELGTSRQALTLPALPPLPTMQTTRGYERGTHTGMQTSSAMSAQLVLMKDPFNTTRILAYGFDSASETNLFVYSVANGDLAYFLNMWNLDIAQWRAAHSASGPALDCTTDGIGGVPPQPRPGLTNAIGWEQAFYAYQMQSQIDQEVH